MHSLTATAIALLSAFSVQFGYAQNNPVAGNGGASAPDDWLLTPKGPKWWYQTTPSPQPKALNVRAAKAAEQTVINEARALMANRPAKAFALLDGDNVLHTEFKAPADANSLFFGFSMGKTVTAMAVGQAICAGKLSLQTKASELIPKLQGKALGDATVHDLLRMSSGTAQINADSTIWNKEQVQDWRVGLLNLEDLIASDPVTQAARGVFSAYKPGEVFAYKSTDPLTLGIMVSRATNTPWNQWIQEQVLNPMGAAYAGLYVQDRAQNGLADSGFLQFSDCLFCMRFDDIGYQDMSCIFAVNGHMHNSSYMMAILISNAKSVHLFGITGSYTYAVNFGNHTITTDFFNISNTISVDWFSVCFLQALADRMGGRTLGKCCIF